MYSKIVAGEEWRIITMLWLVMLLVFDEQFSLDLLLQLMYLQNMTFILRFDLFIEK